VIHVAPGELRTIADDYSDISITEEALKHYEENIAVSARKKMEKQVARVPSDRTVKVNLEAAIGRPEEEIVRFQREKRIDLVVIASLGKSGLSRYTIGSVARSVLKDAKCPVLLTK
jgi:universal stress protein A